MLDVFVANAGTAISKPILEQTLEEYRTQMSVNRKYWLLQAHTRSILTSNSRRRLLLRQVCR